MIIEKIFEVYDHICKLGIQDYILVLLPALLAVVTVVIEIRKSKTNLLKHKVSILVILILLLLIPLSLHNLADSKIEDSRRTEQLKKIDTATEKLETAILNVSNQTISLKTILSNIQKEEISYREQMKKIIVVNNGEVADRVDDKLNKITKNHLLKINYLTKSKDFKDIVRKKDIIGFASKTDFSNIERSINNNTLDLTKNLKSVLRKKDLNNLATANQFDGIAKKIDLKDLITVEGLNIEINNLNKKLLSDIKDIINAEFKKQLENSISSSIVNNKSSLTNKSTQTKNP